MIKKTFISVMLLLNSASILAHSNKSAAPPNEENIINETSVKELNQFKFYPQLTIWGLVGDNISGEVQVMLPIFGNQSSLFYFVGDGTVVYDSNQWDGIFGIGYRRVVNEKILGGYILGKYVNTEGNNGTWSINPGVEGFWKLWEFRTNGHISLGDKKWIESEGWESDRGVDSYVYQTGHEYYDNKYIEYSYATDFGADFEVGRTFPKLLNMKLFTGGYYYHYGVEGNDPIFGASVRAELPVNRYVSLDLRTSYDNYKHGAVFGGIKINLGGISSDSKEKYGISGKLMEPVMHNVAYNYVGLPLKNSYVDNANRELKYDHVWYFDSGLEQSEQNSSGAENSEDGTYENPYHYIDENTMSFIENSSYGGDYAHLFFAGDGNSYSLNGFEDSRMALPNNYDVMGRSNNFQLSAEGDDRPIFYGGIDIYERNNILDSFILYNNYEGSGKGEQNVGMFIYTNTNLDEDPNDVTITNVVIGSKQSYQLGYNTGIKIYNTGKVTIDNSNVYGYSDDSSFCYGIYTDDSGLTLLNNNVIYSYTEDANLNIGIYSIDFSKINIVGENNNISAESGTYDGMAIGIEAFDQTIVEISGNKNSISAVATNEFGYADGIVAFDSTKINISGSNNIISGSALAAEGSSKGMFIQPGTTLNISGNYNTISAYSVGKDNHASGIYSSGAYIYINGNNNTISAYTSTGENVASFGIFSDFSTIYINGLNNIISVSSIEGDVFGIFLYRNSSLEISGNGNIISAESYSKTYGIYGESSDNLNINGVTFNIAQNSDPSAAYGIYLESEIKQGILNVSGNIFNIGGTSTERYGIYSEKGFDEEEYDELINDNVFNGIDDHGYWVAPVIPIEINFTV